MATTRRLNPDSMAGNARITTPTAKPKAPAITKIAASSSYLQGEQAAARQLGTKGLAARSAQLPTAARKTARGMLEAWTGIDVSSKGVKVDPLGLAMALPLGKVIRAAKALKAVGKIGESEALAARVAAKSLGGSRKALQATREARTLYWPAPKDLQYMGRGTSGKAVRGISEKVFPRLPSMAGIPGAKRSFDIYADPLEEGAYRFSGGVKPGRSRSWNPTVNVSISEAVGSGFKKIGKARKSGPRAK